MLGVVKNPRIVLYIFSWRLRRAPYFFVSPSGEQHRQSGGRPSRSKYTCDIDAWWL